MSVTRRIPGQGIPHGAAVIAAAALLSVLLLSSPPAAAQQLAPGLCPNLIQFRPRPFAFFPYNPAAGGIPMLRRTVDRLLHPDALCNDGSPAVMYIRPAHAAYGGNPNPPGSQWLIFFDGGGGCRDADSCLLDRWCGGGGEIFDQAGKMSSRRAPAAIREVPGIWMHTPPAGIVNQFATYNQVLVHYCSSDNWGGSARLRGLSTSTGVSFDIRFEGEAIVNAVFDTLLAGPTAADPEGQEFYQTALPPLSAATRVLIGAESAGTGIVHHLDRLRDRLLTVNPQMDVRGVLDAGFTPAWHESFISWADPFSPGDYRDYLLRVVEPVSRSFRGMDNTAMDASCLDSAYQASHEMIANSAGGFTTGSHPQVCHDNAYVRLNHLVTPVFVRHDINDTLGRELYITWNALLPPGYWDAQYDQLGRVVAGAGLEAPAATSGVQGTNCGKHVTIQTTNGFFRDRVNGPGLPPLSFHDLLVNWLNGVGPSDLTIQIQDDFAAGAPYTSSICF